MSNNLVTLFSGWRNSDEYLDLFKEELDAYLGRDISKHAIDGYDFKDTVIIRKYGGTEFVLTKAFYVQKVLPWSIFFEEDKAKNFEGETETFYAVLTCESGYFLFADEVVWTIEQKHVQPIKLDDVK